MKALRQRYKSDCFPTCLAMMMEISWKAAVKLIHPRRKKYQGYETNIANKMYPLLKELGFEPIKKDSLYSLPDSAIVLLSSVEGIFHTVVWDYEEQRIIDPYPQRTKEKLPVSFYQSRVVSTWI